MHSWRVLLLPYIEANYFSEFYDLSQPWNGDGNSKLMGQYVVTDRGTKRELTTTQIYTHVTIQRVREVHDRTHPGCSDCPPSSQAPAPEPPTAGDQSDQ